jgi:hypothetical protein
MSSQQKCTSPQPPVPPHRPSPSIFTPAFQALLEGLDEPLTAAEADLAGPWKLEPAEPGEVAVLREWESREAGDLPRAVFRHEETAALAVLALPLLGREPLFHLAEEPGPKGHAVTAVFGEQGPQAVGWLEQHEPALLGALHLLEGLVRSPKALAQLLRIAGGLALRQAGRILAADEV